jgi:dipeptidyl aminopeptidase/acylaminoacyl peptidase
LALALLAPAASTPLRAQAPGAVTGGAGRAFTPADWYRLTTLSAPALSPDGRRVAFTVTTVVEKENKRHSEVWMAPVTGGAPVRLTAPGYESSNPEWSHDGKLLFFTSRRPGGEGARWVLRMDQPGGEATQLPDYPSGSVPRDGAFAVWADTATAIADSAKAAKAADPFEKMPATARPPFGALTRPLVAARFDGRHVVDMGYKANGRGFLANRREARRWRPAQLWRRGFDGSPKRQLTSTAYSHRGVTVSPDGRRVAFLADAELRPDSVVDAERDSLARLPFDRARDETPRNDVDVFVLDLDRANATPRRVARWTGAENDLAWSPDSRRLLFVGRPARTASQRLYVVDAAGGEPRELLRDFRYEPADVSWLANGTIMMTAAVGGRTGIFRVSPDGGVSEVVGGRRRITGASFDARSGTMAFVATSASVPTELFVAGLDGKNERRITGFNDALRRDVAFADAERFTYQSVGGLEIEGWLMKPHGYQAGRKYPLVLYIHGGPHSAYGENWFDEFQNLAGAGMWVLYTNPRGSSGYGADFTFSTRGRWGAEDYEDLMKAVDIAAARPDVDSTRMGVTGGSYGGFMTAWITTKTNRFRAAQADRMISNWHSWYGTSDAQGLTE